MAALTGHMSCLAFWLQLVAGFGIGPPGYPCCVRLSLGLVFPRLALPGIARGFLGLALSPDALAGGPGALDQFLVDDRRPRRRRGRLRLWGSLRLRAAARAARGHRHHDRGLRAGPPRQLAPSLVGPQPPALRVSPPACARRVRWASRARPDTPASASVICAVARLFAAAFEVSSRWSATYSGAQARTRSYARTSASSWPWLADRASLSSCGISSARAAAAPASRRSAAPVAGSSPIAPAGASGPGSSRYPGVLPARRTQSSRNRPSSRGGRPR